MDLGTIRKKIDRGAYFSRHDCLADIQLVWDNARTFNAPGHFVHQAADILEKFARDKIDKLDKDEALGIFDQPKKPKLEMPVPGLGVPRPERRAARKVCVIMLLWCSLFNFFNVITDFSRFAWRIAPTSTTEEEIR